MASADGNPDARHDVQSARLRDRLLDAQFNLIQSKSGAVAILLTGVPGAGRSESVSQLLEWLDPKFIDVHAYPRKDTGSAGRPPLWRFWQDLPARGRAGIFFGAWYEEWVYGRSRRGKRRAADARHADRINQLERMLVQEGIHVLKVHLHIGKGEQRKRLDRLESRALTRWRVTREDRWMAAHAGKVDAAFAKCMGQTGVAAPWHTVDGTDARRRALEVGRLVLSALESAAGVGVGKPVRKAVPRRKVRGLTVRREASRLAAPEYEEALLAAQARLARLSRKKRFLDRGAVVVFEGMDAAGKGGAIRRLVHALDPRQYRIVPVSAPSSEDRLYPWLWRFWKCIPGRGHYAIFDRSWYGRVLVERVRAFATDDEWQRAFDEINEFEGQLVESGFILCKFWLDVSSKVQLERFLERDADPLKRFKVDPEDWTNRDHFPAFRRAAAEMVQLTGTRQAPWTVVDADDKQQARIVVLDAVAQAIDSAIG